jgi:hypothetical protein
MEVLSRNLPEVAVGYTTYLFFFFFFFLGWGETESTWYPQSKRKANN